MCVCECVRVLSCVSVCVHVSIHVCVLGTMSNVCVVALYKGGVDTMR